MAETRGRSRSRTRSDASNPSYNDVVKKEAANNLRKKKSTTPTSRRGGKKKSLPAADPESPQPNISSDDEGSSKIARDNREEVKEKSTTTAATTAASSTTTEATTLKATDPNKSEMSRLFAPYRSIGVVTSGRPFYLIPHQNSASAMLALPIGDRFHLVQCDRLQPILVSQKVPSLGSRLPQHIAQLVSDATLSITVVAHGRQHCPTSVTLYARTRPIQTVSVVASKKNAWKIIDFLHLGRMKIPMSGEKEGKEENATIVAAILSKMPKDSDDGAVTDENVAVVGESDEEGTESDDSANESDDDDDDDDDDATDCHCQVVILLATREKLQIYKRISLTTQPTFVPRVALHPSTYINKIVLGGYFNKPATAAGGEQDFSIPALLLLNIRSGKVVHEFSCLGSKKKARDTTVSALEQSPAVDTVAVGTSGGKVHLVNLRHDKVLFTLSHKPRDLYEASKRNNVKITSISFRTDGSAMNYNIAPMAVGRSDGTITVWDLNPPDNDDENDNTKTSKRARQILCEMIQEHPQGVSKLMYLPQEPLLVSIGKKSNAILMHIFDNPDHSGRILRQRKGHIAPPCRIRYLHPGATAGGGIMVNMADGTDAAACQILSSGGDDRTLRVFSTARSVLDKEYSQGKGLIKKAKNLGLDSTAQLLLPPLTAMAMSEARTRDWGDLVTIHQDHAMAYVWSTKRGAQWGPVLRQPKWNVSAMKVPPPPSAHAVSVAMSSCGNFAVVGTKGGVIYKYNVQSGNTRGCFPRDAEDEAEDRQKRLQMGDVKRTMKALEKKMKISNRPSNLDKQDQDAVQEALLEQRRQAKLREARHDGAAVTGLAVDSTNKTMISVGADAKLILWNFASHAPHNKSPYKLPSPATMMCHIQDSDLAAIALRDYSTLLFDCTTLSIVRRFGSSGAEKLQHSGPISDLAFSPDGRTLYTASLDSTIRVWDVPTNCCVDWLAFETPPTSLAISPTGEFLATTHMGKLGLSVWSDKSFYQTVNVNGAKELEQPSFMDEPRPIAEVWEQNTDDSGKLSALVKGSTHEATVEASDDASDDLKVPVVAKQDGLVTLSNLPPAHWKNLFHLELVKERNKPKEAPKKPPSAPFFLQWRGGEPITEKQVPENNAAQAGAAQDDEDEWKAAWSDDDDDGNGESDVAPVDVAMSDKDGSGTESANKSDSTKPSGKKRGLFASPESRIINSSSQKRKKITHHRSQLATMLQECHSQASKPRTRRFQAVTDHIASLGPSAIDVSLSSLCNGMHDLDEGLPLLRMACMWLVEACESRERYEAVNAYLHRFLYVHATIIAGIEDKSYNSPGEKEKSVLSMEVQEGTRELDDERKQLIQLLSELRKAQQSALESLQCHLQSSLCLLRHFSRMV